MSTVAEPTLFCARVRYVKHGRLRYLAHLELLRTMDRLVRRAGLPFAVSQGFSPRMRLAFGPALPVGVASDDEWLDIVLTRLVPADELLARLQAVSCDDLMPQQAAYVDLRSPSLSANLTIAHYEATVQLQDAGLNLAAAPSDFAARVQAACDEVVAAGRIEYLRTGKPKVVELAEKIVRAPQASVPDPAAEPLGGALVSFVTRSSNEGALRPDVLMGEVRRRLGAIPTAGGCGRGDEGVQGAPDVVSSHEQSTRVRIVRRAQYLEREDGTWVRPI